MKRALNLLWGFRTLYVAVLYVPPLFLSDGGFEIFPFFNLTSGFASVVCSIVLIFHRFSKNKYYYLFSLIVSTYIVFISFLGVFHTHLNYHISENPLAIKVPIAIVILVGALFAFRIVKKYPIIKSPRWLLPAIIAALLANFVVFFARLPMWSSTLSVVDSLADIFMSIILGLSVLIYYASRSNDFFTGNSKVLGLFAYSSYLLSLFPWEGKITNVLVIETFSQMSLFFFSLAVLFLSFMLMIRMVLNTSQIKPDKESMLDEDLPSEILKKLVFEKEGILTIDPSTLEIVGSNQATTSILGSWAKKGSVVTEKIRPQLFKMVVEASKKGFYQDTLRMTSSIINIRAGYIQTQTGPLVVCHIQDVTNEIGKTQEDFKKTRMLKSMVEASSAINQLQDFEQICRVALTIAADSMSMETGMIAVVSDDSKNMDIFARFGALPPTEQAQKLIINTVKNKEEFLADGQEVQGLGYKSVIIVPFTIGLVWRGALFLASKEPRGLTRRELSFSRAIANQIGVAAERNQMNLDLKMKVEELEKSAKMKDDFIASISHEFNTPLTSIIGYLEVLTSELSDLTPKQKEFLGDITSSTETLHWLIGSMLDIAVQRSGRYKFKMAKFDPEDVFYNTLRGTFNQANAKGVAVQLEFSGSSKGFIGDPSVFESILKNLLRALLTYLRKDDKLRIIGKVENGRMQVTATENVGHFFNEDISSLTDAFTKIPSKELSDHPGSIGLALTYVKEFALAQGGMFDIESTQSQTVFKLELPDIQLAL